LFKTKEISIIDQDEDKYLSFPDIIRSKKNPKTFFIVYREGNNHHPTWSNLVLMRSRNNGRTWKKFKEFPSTLRRDGAVWNCPRLSYLNEDLIIICDKKSGTRERIATFTSYFITIEQEKWEQEPILTPFTGMVPDKIIPFKDKLFCANHKIKSVNNDLIQLVNWSKDDEDLWYSTSIIANSPDKQFCEASLVNVDDDYLLAYLRDNSGHKKHVYVAKSYNGTEWEKPKKLSIFGQRITAIKEGENVIGTYRNTGSAMLSIFEHNLKTNNIQSYDIDWENYKNLYHFGYTGISKLDDNLYLVAYYIKQEQDNPFIKLAVVERS
jgi:hypothetical protein